MRALGFCCLLIYCGVCNAFSSISGKVIEVIDGNTVLIRCAEEGNYKVVLHLIDSPDPGQPYADEARKYLERMLLQKEVVLRLEGKDRWGNYLGVVWLQGSEDIRLELIRRGLAWVTENCRDPQLLSLFEQARQQKAGLWADDHPTAPWIYRRQQSIMTPKSS